MSPATMNKTKGLSSGQLKPPTGKPVQGNKAKTKPDNPLSSGQIRYHKHAAAAKPSTQIDMLRKAATDAMGKGTTPGSRPTFISSMLRRMDGIASPKSRSDGKICEQHNAVPGEKIREYTVVKRLGNGVFGSVCKVRGPRGKDPSAPDSDTYALKISGGEDFVREQAIQEFYIVQLLTELDKDGVKKTLHLLDMFDYNHDGYIHNCLVFAFMGMSLCALLEKNEYRRLPRMQIRNIAYQLFKSLAFLHKLSIVHTDLKPDNILLRIERLRSIPQPNGPARLIPANTEICIIDYGLAKFTQGEKQDYCVQAPVYRAPEVCLGVPWTPAIDVFAVGLILFELRFGELFFTTYLDDLHQLAVMHVLIGPMSEKMAKEGARVHPYIFKKNKEGKIVLNRRNFMDDNEMLHYIKLRQKRKKRFRNDNIDRLFRDLFRKMLKYDVPSINIFSPDKGRTYQPGNRITAEQALRHKYFAEERRREREQERFSILSKANAFSDRSGNTVKT